VVSKGLSYVEDLFAPPDDYDGQGTGAVMIEIEKGDSLSTIGVTLEKADVVASADAFTDAASNNPDALSIQSGFYQMKLKMSAKSAVDLLLSGNARAESQLTIPEGLTVDEIVKVIDKETEIKAADLRKALKQPQSLGLPAYAGNDAEGYLFPATYPIPPDASARDVLTMMVDEYKQVAAKLNLEAAARQAGMKPADVVTVASLVEAEASRPEDQGKVARVIDNRVENGDLLQLDSTVHYAIDGTTDGVFTSDADRATGSPYNTYRFPGLPPGPIDSPGEAALEAALNPTPGNWTYFVTVNLETGETLFASTLAQHNANVAKLQKYCASSDLC
jgi:peptidoglycan lytic transglycosylase G